MQVHKNVGLNYSYSYFDFKTNEKANARKVPIGNHIMLMSILPRIFLTFPIVRVPSLSSSAKSI